MSFLQRRPVIIKDCYSTQHLYRAGYLTLQPSANSSPKITANLQTQKTFRKYFGKKLRSLANDPNYRPIRISTYRCKSLRTLILLNEVSMRSPIITLRNLEILSEKLSLNRISAYKNLTSLKIDVLSFDLDLAFAHQMRTLIHLRSLSFTIFEHSLAKMTRHIIGLKSLKHLDIQIIQKPYVISDKNEVIVKDFYFALMKSKTLSSLRLDIRHIFSNSNPYMLRIFFQNLAQAVIPNFDIDILCPKDCNMDLRCWEGALSKVDLLTVDRNPYSVRLSTNQENPHQSISQARRKLNLYIPSLTLKSKYISRAKLYNPKTTKNDFDLAKSLKLFFCGTLDTSFYLFNTSKIKCVKAIRVDCEPLHEDRTLEGLKNLLNIIQNSPSLEQVEMSQVNFSQEEIPLILDELSHFKQLETLELKDASFYCSPEQEDRKARPSFSSLKKLNLDFRILRHPDVEVFEFPFEFTSLKNLTELTIKCSSLNSDERDNMLKVIEKLSNLEKITVTDMLILIDVGSVMTFIDTMQHLAKLKEVYVFLQSPTSGILASIAAITISNELHQKVMELLKKNRSIEKFIIKDKLFEIKCIRF